MTVKFECLGFGMITKLMLSWTQLNVKFKCNGLRRLPSPNALGLICSPEPHYLILLGVPKRGCVFLWACPRLGILPNTIVLGAKPSYIWVQLVPDSAFSGLGTLSSLACLHQGVLVFLKIYTHKSFFIRCFFGKDILIKTWFISGPPSLCDIIMCKDFN